MSIGNLEDMRPEVTQEYIIQEYIEAMKMAEQEVEMKEFLSDPDNYVINRQDNQDNQDSKNQNQNQNQ